MFPINFPSVGFNKWSFVVSLASCLSLLSCSSTESEGLCSEETGTVEIELTSPIGITGSITLKGPNGFSRTLVSSDTLSRLEAGNYALTYKRVKVPGATVGRAYYGRIDQPTFALSPCGRQSVSIEYVQEPGSERMYVIEGSSIRAFAASQLIVTGSVEPVNTLKTPAGPKSMAFDDRGNLWFSHSEGVSMYAMEDLAKPDAEYSVKLTGWGVDGDMIPGAGPLAFDSRGRLWVGQIAMGKVSRFAREQLGASGTPMPDTWIQAYDLKGVEGLAFDKTGNLWATNSDNQVVKYSVDGLVGPRQIWSGSPDVRIVHESAPPSVGVYAAPNTLAFNKDEDLWIGYFAGNDMVKLPKAKQEMSDTIQPPAVALRGSVLGLLEGMAFDESGALWVPGQAGEVIQIAAEHLNESGDIVADLTLTSPSISYAGAIVFNPAPAGLSIRDADQ